MKNKGSFDPGHGLAPCKRVQVPVLMVLLCAISPRCFAQISVSISPTTPTVATLATQQFTATVTGTTNAAVTWEVNGLAGGSSVAA